MIRCRINQKFYIGSSVNIKKRWQQHQSQLNLGIHHCVHLQRAWNLYGSNSFVFSVVESAPKNILILREQAWIDCYWDFGVLYNTARYAETSALGLKRTTEQRQRISAACMGRKNSTEMCEKISMGLVGKTHSKETKFKMSESHKKLTRSPIHCKNIGRSKLGHNVSIETRSKISTTKKNTPWSDARRQAQENRL